MDRRKTINPRLFSNNNHRSSTNSDDDLDLEKINDLIHNRISILKLTDIREKQSRLVAKEKEIDEKLNQLEELKGNYEKLYDEHEDYRQQIRRYRLLSQTLLRAENVEKFALQLQHHCTEQKIPIEDDETIIRTLLGMCVSFGIFLYHNNYDHNLFCTDIIQSYQLSDDENLLKNYRQFQQEIMKIIGPNFIIQNHPESYQSIKRLLYECKKQEQNSENLEDSWQELRRIHKWLKLRNEN